MSPTHTIPANLAADLAATLTRLRAARANNDADQVIVAEARLNALLDRLTAQQDR